MLIVGGQLLVTFFEREFEMKNVILVCLGLLALVVGGCASTPPGYYEGLAESVKSGTDAQKEATAEIIAAVRASELVAEDKIDSIEENSGKVFEAIAVLQTAAAEAAKVYDEKAQEDKVGAWIEAAIVANTASTPVNPYAPLIGGALTLLSGGYAIKKRKDAIDATAGKKVSDAKYRAHKTGTEAFRLKNQDKASELYSEIGKARKDQGIS